MSAHPAPPPATPNLLELFRHSLGSDETFLWRQRLVQERLMRNITEKHERALLYVHGLISAGDDHFDQPAVARELGIGISAFRDALRRAQGIGLLAAQARYSGGRRTTNRYLLLMPHSSPVPRPDLRRHSTPKSKPCLNLLPSSSAQCNERAAWPVAARISREQLAAQAEARLIRAWAARPGRSGAS
jgi:hypothetical protein